MHDDSRAQSLLVGDVSGLPSQARGYVREDDFDVFQGLSHEIQTLEASQAFGCERFRLTEFLREGGFEHGRDVV
ncbi:hypothetical protein [Maritimibacter alkaliphilus]|uniref:hypothetical protein n=1 Tax=Maritimibacter alkaliphilus TaxID=404236 RepID=UPI001C957A0A|nr:hypothetical protein [Maritimibacter alkaliphilus]MBY6089605.1 hypothetical protein [Maritimibacter alkaliphilus]